MEIAALPVPASLAYLLENFFDVFVQHTERNWVSCVGQPDSAVPRTPAIPSQLSSLQQGIFGSPNCPPREQLVASRKLLSKPLTNIQDVQNQNRAVDSNNVLLHFLYDEQVSTNPKDEFLYGSFLAQMSMSNGPLRDELYYQVIAHTIANQVEERRAWMILAGLLSVAPPSSTMINYVLKEVSDRGLDRYKALCQHLILHSSLQCRLYPPCSLEWKAIRKCGRPALEVTFTDGHKKNIGIAGSTLSEELAKTALTPRTTGSTQTVSGWSTVLHINNNVIECGGHGFVCDMLSCVELPRQWSEVTGRQPQKCFLISSMVEMYDSDSEHTPEQAQGPEMSQSRLNQRYLLSNAVHASPDLNRWLDQVNPNLEDAYSRDPRYIQSLVNGGGGGPKIARQASIDRTSELQAALKQQQLENKLLQESLQAEILRKQLAELQSSNKQPEPIAQTQREEPPPPPPVTVPKPKPKPKQEEERRYLPMQSSIPASSKVSFNSDVETIPELRHTSDEERSRTIRVGSIVWPPKVEHSEDHLKKNVGRLQIEEGARPPTPPPVEVTKFKVRKPVVDVPDGGRSRRKSEMRAAEVPRVDLASRANVIASQLQFRKVEEKKPKPVAQPPPQAKAVAVKDPIFVHPGAVPPAPPLPPPLPPPIVQEVSPPASPVIQRKKEEEHVYAKVYSAAARASLPPAPDLPPPAIPASPGVQQHNFQDSPFYMYTLVPWQLKIHKEVLSPMERVDSPQLVDLIYLQIYEDLYKQPCIRFSEEDKSIIKSQFERTRTKFSEEQLLQEAFPVKKMIIDSAKKTQFYFSRNFACDMDALEYPKYEGVEWLSVSHSGVRLARENKPDNVLQCVRLFTFEEIRVVSVKGSIDLTLATEVEQVEVLCEFSVEAKNMIEAFQVENEKRSRMKDTVYYNNYKQSSVVQQPLSPPASLFHQPSLPPPSSPPPLEVPNKRSSHVLQQSALLESSLWMFTPKDVADGALVYPNKVLTMAEYASFNFVEARQKLWKPNQCEELVSWSRLERKRAFVEMRNLDEEKRAVNGHLAVAAIMQDYPLPRGTTEVDLTLHILNESKKSQKFVDEIYLMLCKQTCRNQSPQPESLKKGWRLFAIMTTYLDCSSNLRPYVACYLKECAHDMDRHDHSLALIAKNNFARTVQLGGRKQFPGKEEINELLNGGTQRLVQFTLPITMKMPLRLKPNVIVSEVIEEICAKLKVNTELEVSEYRLYYVLGKKFCGILEPNQYIFDVLSTQEEPAQFTFCRYTWFAPFEVSESITQEYLEITYLQIKQEYLSGKWIAPLRGALVSSEIEEIALLSALQLYIPGMKLPHSIKDLRTTVPQDTEHFLRSTPPPALLKIVENRFIHLQEHPHQAMARFLLILSKWRYFGAVSYKIRVLNIHGPLATRAFEAIQAAKDILVSANRNGVSLRDETTRVDFASYPLTAVESVSIPPGRPDVLKIACRDLEGLVTFEIHGEMMQNLLDVLKTYTDLAQK